MKLRKGMVEIDDNYVQVAVENIWARVRRWAKRNGYQHQSTYGVVGVAPT